MNSRAHEDQVVNFRLGRFTGGIIDFVNVSGFRIFGSGNSSYPDFGSGISIESDNNMIFFNNCSNNRVGISLWGRNCTIMNNIVGGDGGGLYDCDGEIKNCTIANNMIDYWGFGYGGGLYGCDGLISNCIISGNKADDGGGLAGCHGTVRNAHCCLQTVK